jgi:hypothetical protein
MHQSTQNAGARLQSAQKQSAVDRSRLSELYHALQNRFERGSDPSEHDVQQICKAIGKPRDEVTVGSYRRSACSPVKCISRRVSASGGAWD